MSYIWSIWRLNENKANLFNIYVTNFNEFHTLLNSFSTLSRKQIWRLKWCKLRKHISKFSSGKANGWSFFEYSFCLLARLVILFLFVFLNGGAWARWGTHWTFCCKLLHRWFFPYPLSVSVFLSLSVNLFFSFICYCLSLKAKSFWGTCRNCIN